jgi:hypothetical protein
VCDSDGGGGTVKQRDIGIVRRRGSLTVGQCGVGQWEVGVDCGSGLLNREGVHQLARTQTKWTAEQRRSASMSQKRRSGLLNREGVHQLARTETKWAAEQRRSAPVSQNTDEVDC